MINPQEIYQKLVEAGNAWAEKDRIAYKDEKSEKIVLAALANEVEGSVSAKEIYARSHARYKQHLDIMSNSRWESNVAWVEYESRKTYADLIRTKEATQRAANRDAP